MKNNTQRPVRLIMIMVFVLMPVLGGAMPAADLQDFRILGYHFTTRVASDEKVFFTNTPEKARIVVFKVSADVAANDGKLFLDDFVLRYVDSNKEERRSSAVRICTAQTSQVGEESDCLAARSGWINVGTGKVIFTVAFYLQNDVQDLDILTVGTSGAVHYNVGGQRPYTVYITTKQESDTVAKIAAVIKKGGYRVLRSTGLRSDVDGVSIYYSKYAEVQAREVSQRIMSEIGVAPEMNDTNLINSDSDIVVWVGKGHE